MSAPPSPGDGAPPPAGAPSFRTAVRFWALLGCISFGGPAGQIAIMHQELVERRGWVGERRFLRALAFCFALPGPEAQQLATYSGWRLHGTRGALAAGTLFVVPSFAVLVAASYLYVEHGELAAVQEVIRALGGAIVGIVLAALLRIGGRIARDARALVVAAAAFVATVAGVIFPIVLVCAVLAGILLLRTAPQEPAADPADAEPPMPMRRVLRSAAPAVAIWLAVVGALLLAGGVLADLAAFFTVTALVTFGGAYAVLPFVAQQSVDRFGWLTERDLVAGFALGESTPGPLIMINTFVGYMAGWTTHQSHAWALAGAAVATFCTFAPSFLFILIGAPLADRAAPHGRVAAAMRGIGAAVVGVIGALAVYLGRQTITVDGVDLLAAGLAVGAFIAMARFRVHVVAVVGAAAAVGLVSALAG